MTIFYIITGIIIVIAMAVAIPRGGFADVKEKPKYAYQKKQFFMSRAEHEFYDVLVKAVGNEYLIFAQVHLPTIVDEKIKGQPWKAARAHIDRKSVDFVLCDKVYISPKLAIELDDRTHERENRIERDGEVERILNVAGLPLLRLENHGNFNPQELASRIREKLV